MKEITFPVFIIGMPRSGTTLVSNIINASGEIYIPEETHFFQLKNQWKNKSFLDFKNDYLSEKNIYLEGLNLSEDHKCKIMSSNSFKEMFELICKLKANDKGFQFWGEKTPIHFQSIDEIQSIYPNSKFIHVMRDPRDIINSILAANWGRDSLYRRLKMNKQSLKLFENKNKNIYHLKFEELVTNPEPCVEKLYLFLELHYKKEILDTFYLKSNQNFSLKKEPWKKNNLNPINADNAFKWKQLSSRSEIRRNKFISWFLQKELSSTNYEKYKNPPFLYRNLKLLIITSKYFTTNLLKKLK